MKNLRICQIILIAALTPAIIFDAACPNYAKEALFKVVKVMQGDLIQVSGPQGKVTVRLAGIDAPELWEPNPANSQPFAVKARDYLEGLIKGKMVRVKSYNHNNGSYLLGEVFLGKKNINLAMIKAGYAEVFHLKNPSNLNLAPYRKAEALAKRAKKGMWVQGDKYQSPTTWCKRQKAKSLCSFILYGILQQGPAKK